MELAVDMVAQTQEREQESSIAVLKNGNPTVTLKFEDVVYTVKIKNQGLISKKNKKCEEKTILKGISGIVLPGEIMAMLGPSGSGKTTLLTALGGRLSGHLNGTVSYNGKRFTSIMKRSIGFVTQDDILYPHLTVTETLVFTALLRLPNTLTVQQKIEHAESTITQLGLTRCKDTIIGNYSMRGVSGGERKRVSIGQEMLINPSLLLLDEPTSGLDSTTALRIVTLLRDLANGGRTVVMTIHQPSSRLFYRFHKVLLLSEGNPIYYGKAETALDYFSSVGYAPSTAVNPSDFMLDLSNGIVSGGSQEDSAIVKHKLLSAYNANIAPSLKAELQEHQDNIQEEPNDKHFPRWATTWWQQFTVLLKRGIKQRRHESFAGTKVVQVLVAAFLAGFLWWKSTSLEDQLGLIFFQGGFWGFFPLFQALYTVPQERRMLEKERTSGMYRLSTYLMAQIVGDLPMELSLPTVFCIITYWMAGLKRTAQNFILTLLALLLSVLVSQGLGLALGATFLNLKLASTAASVLMLTFQLAGGFFVQKVPRFIFWVKYLSLSQYTYKLMLGAQYKSGETYHCTSSKSGVCLVEDFDTIKHVGLNKQVVAVVALLIMLIGYRVIAYVALTRVGVIKS